jgi:hypothetical protein
MLQEIASLNLGKYRLVRATAADTKVSQVDQPIKQVHHIFILDCSGSMYHQLGQIRTDLYNKISTLMKPEDSVTIIWFSSRGEFGVLVEDFRLKSDASLNKLRDVIERELRPRGLTAFKDPLVEAKKIIARTSEKNKDLVHSLFFLTDGHDNQYSEKEIIASISELKPLLVSAAIVEYGYYCNRRLLSDMSMEVGGVHVFSSDFQDYEPYLKKQFEQSVRSERKKVQFGKVHGDIVFARSGDAAIVYKVGDDGNAFIDVDAGDIFYLDTPVASKGIEDAERLSRTSAARIVQEVEQGNADPEHIALVQGAYVAMFAFSRKSDYATISDILRTVGDAYFIRKKANTFGTQKINELEAEFLQAANDANSMFVEGYNPKLEPKEDAYCVMDMIDDLMEHEDNLWYPLDPAFSYQRIGRKAVLAGKKASKEDKDAIKLLIEKNNTAGAIQKLQELEEPSALKFEYKDKAKGHPIYNLVWNNSRANLSVQVLFEGTVELPDNTLGLPKVFDTKRFRNFTIIKDGIINTYRLPVSLNKATFDKLQKNDLLQGETYEEGKMYILDFSSLPVINQKMVSQVSAKELFQNQFKLAKLQARNTVFNHLKKAYFDNVSIDFAAKYGEEAAAWLKELGITPNGFAPRVTLEPSTEEALVNTLEVKIDKMTIPNTKKDFEAIMTKIDKGMGLTPREKLLEGPIKEFKAFEKLNDGLKDEDRKMIIEKWLTARSADIRKEKSKLMNDISRTKFATIVGKSWFSDLDGRDDKEMLLEIEGEERKFIIEDKLETIKV